MNIFGVFISKYFLFSTLVSMAVIQLSARVLTAALHIRYDQYKQKWGLLIHPSKYANAYNFYELSALCVLCFVPHINVVVAILAPMWFYCDYDAEVKRMAQTSLGSAQDLKKRLLLRGADEARV